MRQTGRIEFSYQRSCEWLLALLLLLAPRFTTAQYASSAYYNSRFYDHNQQQQQQDRPQPRSFYPDIPVSYNQQYPAAVESIWSTAPIVVTDETQSIEQDRRYLPTNYYNQRETGGRSYNNNYNSNVPTTRAANHNYNNVLPNYFYNTETGAAAAAAQAVQPPAPVQLELEQRELLAVADSQREEEQIVRIGGTRTLANNNNNYSNNNYDNNNNNNYFEPPQTLANSRDFAAKYAKHYADYLLRYPQRLQPFYNTGAAYVDK